MNISKKSEYALRALIAMARSPRSYQIQELSQKEKIPVKFLEQILLTLRRAGFLDSKRGVGGGYVLRKAPSQIMVGDVVRAMDGPLLPIPCASHSLSAEMCSCPEPSTCVLRRFMIEVHDRLSEVFDHRSIEDLRQMGPDGGALAFEI